MSKIIKVTDAAKEYPLDFKIEDSGRLGVQRLTPAFGENNLNIATPVNAELLESMQANGVYVCEATHSTNVGLDYYTANIDGLTEFGVFEGLKIKVMISDTNQYDQPKLILNNEEYVLLVMTNTELEPLKANMLSENYFDMIYKNGQFVVENGSLGASENTAGNVSENDIRKIAAESILGLNYGGIFGSDLKVVEKDKYYWYFDITLDIYISFKARIDMGYPNGVLLPNGNFIKMSTNDIGKQIGILKFEPMLTFLVPLGYRQTEYVDVIAEFRILKIRITTFKGDNYFDQDIILFNGSESIARSRDLLMWINHKPDINKIEFIFENRTAVDGNGEAHFSIRQLESYY